ncbi:MAG: hypothetical protein ACYTEK_25980 [Planctomycetota bacterium]
MSNTGSIIAVTCLLVGASCVPSHRIETEAVDDNTLLALILTPPASEKYVIPPGPWDHLNYNDPNEMKKFFEELRRSGAMDYPPYTVVGPQTTFGHVDMNDPREVEQRKKYIQENLKIEAYELSELIDLLCENKKSVRLSVESSRANGYVVDYEGEHDKYFKKDGGSWKKWYEDHPTATGFTHVSLPAYDPKTGIVLVYKSSISGPRFGGGGIIAYKYESGRLKQIGGVGLWII